MHQAKLTVSFWGGIPSISHPFQLSVGEAELLVNAAVVRGASLPLAPFLLLGQNLYSRYSTKNAYVWSWSRGGLDFGLFSAVLFLVWGPPGNRLRFLCLSVSLCKREMFKNSVCAHPLMNMLFWGIYQNGTSYIDFCCYFCFPSLNRILNRQFWRILISSIEWVTCIPEVVFNQEEQL